MEHIFDFEFFIIIIFRKNLFYVSFTCNRIFYILIHRKFFQKKVGHILIDLSGNAFIFFRFLKIMKCLRIIKNKNKFN